MSASHRTCDSMLPPVLVVVEEPERPNRGRPPCTMVCGTQSEAPSPQSRVDGTLKVSPLVVAEMDAHDRYDSVHLGDLLADLPTTHPFVERYSHRLRVPTHASRAQFDCPPLRMFEKRATDVSADVLGQHPEMIEFVVVIGSGKGREADELPSDNGHVDLMVFHVGGRRTYESRPQRNPLVSVAPVLLRRDGEVVELVSLVRLGPPDLDAGY